MEQEGRKEGGKGEKGGEEKGRKLY